ncbi:hypothetical protein GCK32_012715 [Trichostrongylus colubriformis]|uniref:Uncharacterized protein n=1 Tax=Trichostrongylus colubriformis TaxID=6319 RepID=A0AAN8IUK9_TRICO
MHERTKHLRITKDPAKRKRTKNHDFTTNSEPKKTSGKDLSTHSTKTILKDKHTEQTIQTTENVTHHPTEAITSLSSHSKIATGADRSIAVTTPAPQYPHQTATGIHSSSESTSSVRQTDEESSTLTSLLADRIRTAQVEVGPMPYDVISHDDLDILRRKARVAFHNTKQRSQNLGASMNRHWIWILFILPGLVLFGYVVFVALKRQTYYRTHPREPTFDHATLHAEERLAQWRAFGIKSTPPGHERFEREKFTDCGPLVLTKELKGDVKFHSVGGSVSEIARVQFDDRLNEVVDIGSAVEVVPEDSHTRGSSIAGEQQSTNKGTGASNAKMEKKGRKFSKEKLSLCETQELDESGEAEKRKFKERRSAERAYTPKRTQGSKEKEA